MTANEFLQQAGISHAIYLERLKTSEVRRIIALLTAIDQELVAKIAARTGETFTKSRLEAMLRDVRANTKEARATIDLGIRELLDELGPYEADLQGRRIRESIPIKWNITPPTPAQIYAAAFSRPFAEGALLADEIERLGRVRLRRVEAVLRRGHAEGEPIAEMVRRLKGRAARNYRDGILGKWERRDVNSLVRTAVSHISQTARREMYSENTDLIKGIQFVATLDTRTTAICASLDGNIYPLNEGPRAPQHRGCRSTDVPVLKSWRELGIDLDEAPPGTRASMNGQVPAKTKFLDWIENGATDEQRQVWFGARRYEMWREGKITSHDLITSQGRWLTLDELRRREAA